MGNFMLKTLYKSIQFKKTANQKHEQKEILL